MVKKIYVVAGVEANQLPFEINDASRAEHKDNDDDGDGKGKFVNVGQKIRLDNRWIDLRTIANHAIFRIQAGVGRFFVNI